MPKVSVIMSAYNAQDYIGEAVNSLLNQTYRDIEIIVGNDASNDRTLDILSEIKDKRLIILDRKENKGSYYTLNECIDKASGEYVANLDADDASKPQRIEKQVELMDSLSNTVLCATDYDFLYSDGHTEASGNMMITSKQKRFSMPFGNYSYAHSSFMMRSRILNDNNIRYGDFLYSGDYDIQRKLSRYGDLSLLPESLIFYRIHENQNTVKYKQSLRYSEFFSIQDGIVDDLPVDDTIKAGLLVGIHRTIRDKETLEMFVNAYNEYAGSLEMLNQPDEKTFLRYVFQSLMINQKASPSLLSAIISKGMRYFPYNAAGFYYMIKKCLFRINEDYVEYMVLK